MQSPSRCPCGSGLELAQCCALLLQGGVAADAQALMRSRYSAYALGLEQYLLDSWHHSTRPASLNLAVEQRGLKWIGLDLQRHQQIDANHALVEFVARYKTGGRAQRMHELSRFIREDGRWFYLGAASTDTAR